MEDQVSGWDEEPRHLDDGSAGRVRGWLIKPVGKIDRVARTRTDYSHSLA